jgi:cyclase
MTGYKRIIITFSFYFSILALCMLLLFLVDLVSPSHAQKFKDVDIIANQLTNETYMLVGKGGNIGVSVGDDGVLLIDSQFRQLTDKIMSTINNKITDKAIKFLINTHWHQDHTDGNENLVVKNGAIVIAHDNVRERLSNEQFVSFLNKTFEPSPINALPTITYNDSITLYFNDDKIDVYHIPNAHTDGDSIIYFNKNNVVHTGDIFVNGRYPFIDHSSGGSINGIITGIEKIMSIINNETKIIPGHGLLSNLDELQDYLSMLKDIRKQVQTMVNNGSNLEEIIKSDITTNYDSLYSNSFVSSKDFLRFVYDDIVLK